jgi:hypothetical protein
VTESAPIVLTPEPNRTPLRVAARGSVLMLLKEDGDWCQVQFQDPDLGLRTGWVQRRFVQVQPEALQPRDLSVPTDGARSAHAGCSSCARAPRTRGAGPRSAPAGATDQAPIPADYVPPERTVRRVPNTVFLDGNFMSFRPQQKALSLSYVQPKFLETQTSTVNYPALPAIQSADASVSFVMGHNVGFGFRVLIPRYTERRA